MYSFPIHKGVFDKKYVEDFEKDVKTLFGNHFYRLEKFGKVFFAPTYQIEEVEGGKIYTGPFFFRPIPNRFEAPKARLKIEPNSHKVLVNLEFLPEKGPIDFVITIDNFSKEYQELINKYHIENSVLKNIPFCTASR